MLTMPSYNNRKLKQQTRRQKRERNGPQKGCLPVCEDQRTFWIELYKMSTLIPALNVCKEEKKRQEEMLLWAEHIENKTAITCMKRSIKLVNLKIASITYIHNGDAPNSIKKIKRLKEVLMPYFELVMDGKLGISRGVHGPDPKKDYSCSIEPGKDEAAVQMAECMKNNIDTLEEFFTLMFAYPFPVE